MAKRATRIDVAQLAGVSQTTVTYVLGDRYDFSIPESTRERVRQVAKSIGYQPNAVARALASGRSNSVTIAVPYEFDDYMARIIRAFERETNAHGYHLTASTIGHGDVNKTSTDLSELLSNLTDAIVLVEIPTRLVSAVTALLPSYKPMISMGCFAVPGLDAVHVDLQPGVVATLDHLLAANPKRLAFFRNAAEEDNQSEKEYQSAYVGDVRPILYRDAMINANRSIEEIYGRVGNRARSREILKAYIAENGCPDALFCFNDDLAMSAYRALREMGYSVPKDVIVAGCDGSEEGEYAAPQLTTIKQPIEEMCTQAWSLLANRLNGAEGPPEYITVDATLIVGGSTVR